MGHGSWSAATYQATTARNISAGTNFAYTQTMRSAPASQQRAHEDLDPLLKNSRGELVRESLDSADHPNAYPIQIFFDETGSMGIVPMELQKKLTTLYALLLQKGYVEDPQISVGGYGDAFTDAAPLQVSQFESDNRVDDALDKIFLEGNGGGNGGESVALAWLFAAHRNKTDNWDKRGKKTVLITIGDEISHGVKREQARRILGINSEKDFTPEEAVALAQEKHEVFHLIINNLTAASQRSVEFYTKLLGDNAIVLEDHNAVAEVIAGLVGLLEDVVDVDDLAQDFRSAGSDARSINAATKALAKRGAGKGGAGKGQVVVSDAPDDLVSTSGGTSRL